MFRFLVQLVQSRSFSRASLRTSNGETEVSCTRTANGFPTCLADTYSRLVWMSETFHFMTPITGGSVGLVIGQVKRSASPIIRNYWLRLAPHLPSTTFDRPTLAPCLPISGCNFLQNLPPDLPPAIGRDRFPEGRKRWKPLPTGMKGLVGGTGLEPVTSCM